jgi:hypothetical protein
MNQFTINLIKLQTLSDKQNGHYSGRYIHCKYGIALKPHKLLQGQFTQLRITTKTRETAWKNLKIHERTGIFLPKISAGIPSLDHRDGLSSSCMPPYPQQ